MVSSESRNPLHRRICSSKPLRCFCDSYEQTMGFLDICAMDVLLDLWFEALSKTCNNLANINVASVCCNALCNAQFVFAHSTARSLNSETQSVSGHRCFGIVALWRCTADLKRQQLPQNLTIMISAWLPRWAHSTVEKQAPWGRLDYIRNLKTIKSVSVSVLSWKFTRKQLKIVSVISEV